MNKIGTRMNEVNQTFKVNFASNSSFNIKLKEENSPMSLNFKKSNSSFGTKFDKTDNSIDTKTDINNTPEEDVWYDEVIYYDGGGVEGYGN